ncbi:hypothetical protein EYZ11_000447 [Aspergillus tanneri]|uniref:Uncharacterized protein n=1 Tax=Aspergillus tanneri TaxID=1220188 RepID=A0A4S3JX71_9EURO|nr:hypothetical protein EYZ11_000447 [Aspergillus tanneri]
MVVLGNASLSGSPFWLDDEPLFIADMMKKRAGRYGVIKIHGEQQKRETSRM